MPRNRKLAAAQAADGDTRKIGKRKFQQQLRSQPEPSRGLPEAPEHLSGLALEAWKFYREELTHMKLAFQVDSHTLQGVCSHYAIATAADLEIARLGINARNAKRMRELLKIRKDAWDLYNKFAATLGLSPLSRTRLPVDKSNKGQTLMDILSAPDPVASPVLQ